MSRYPAKITLFLEITRIYADVRKIVTNLKDFLQVFSGKGDGGFGFFRPFC
jgi:hypothetical protein